MCDLPILQPIQARKCCPRPDDSLRVDVHRCKESAGEPVVNGVMAKHAVLEFGKTVEVRRDPQRSVGCDGKIFDAPFKRNLFKMPIAETSKPVRHVETEPQVAAQVLHDCG